jgi:hypothetical protein
MRNLAKFGLIACIATTLTGSEVEASTRIYYTCQGKQKTQLHHNYACEYHLNKPFKARVIGGGQMPGKRCNSTEQKSFKTWLCADVCKAAS